MAVFVELDEDDVELPQDVPKGWLGNGKSPKKMQPTAVVVPASAGDEKENGRTHNSADGAAPEQHRSDSDKIDQPTEWENPNRNRMTEALGCYPYADHHCSAPSP